jgi:hypothetical protein
MPPRYATVVTSLKSPHLIRYQITVSVNQKRRTDPNRTTGEITRTNMRVLPQAKCTINPGIIMATVHNTQ